MPRYIDTLPIQPEEIENSQLSTQYNTEYLESLRFSHKIISTISRVRELQSMYKKDPSIKTTIESFILLILYTSSITDPRRKYRNPHYLKRCDLVSQYKEKPPRFYKQEIALSSLRTWGGMYGMPSYCLHLMGDTNHYLTPIEIGDKVVNYYLNSLSLNVNWYYLANFDYLGDQSPYDLTHLLIREDENILSCYQIFKSLSHCLPIFMNQYKEDKDIDNYTKEICHLLILYNFIEETLQYKYIHQQLSSTWNDLFIDLVRLRKRSPSLTNDNIDLFNASIPITTKEDLYKNTSLNMLSWLCPPSGYNLFLQVIAISLLIRSYIQIENDLVEANKSFYEAGLCLRKSNMKHLRTIGNNLIVVSRQTYLPSAKDLLQ